MKLIFDIVVKFVVLMKSGLGVFRVRVEVGFI
jgi:hypothetical protein